MDPRLRPTEGGLEVVDPTTRHRYHIRMPNQNGIEMAKESALPHEVDTAVRTTANTFILPQKESVYILDRKGSIVSNVTSNKQISLTKDTYIFNISKPIKVYIQIKGNIEISVEDGQVHIDTNTPTPVTIGAKSSHTYPLDRIKTTANPSSLIKAISRFGSALKTTGPERSYPTLRRHPPLIELSSELNIPDELERPKTGIQIAVPPTLSHIFVVAPLAYYLGAEVVPGSEPCLSTESGYTFHLDTKNGFESTTNRVLRHIFYLDCIVRTEDSAPGPVQERQKIEPLLEFDISTVYEQPLSKQLETYLEVPFSTVEPHYPSWYPETKVRPESSTLQCLPFLANQLSAVSTEQNDVDYPIDQLGASSEESATGKKPNTQLIKQVWNYKTTTENTSTVPLSAFHNKIRQSPKEGALEIEIVCNEPAMKDELIDVYGTYGNREELPFSVAIHHDLSISQLEEILSRQNDFLHYIGHVDESGFRCSDGRLNASILENIGTDAFFLNACQSYGQGLALVEAGSLGGIVTVSDIQNDTAAEVGGLIARLLNYGYSFAAILDVLQSVSSLGKQYHVVGDGTASVAQSTTGMPSICSISKVEGEKALVSMYAYSTADQKGGIRSPNLNANNSYHLSNDIGPLSIQKLDLLEYFDRGPIPVLLDGEMYWSDAITLDDLKQV